MNAFTGYLPPISLYNELETWDLIIQVADEALGFYPTMLNEDIQILEDTKDKKMNMNIRNCIMFRKNEKEVYQNLKDCAGKVKELAKLSYTDAKLKIDEWRESEDLIIARNLNYFEKVFCELL